MKIYQKDFLFNILEFIFFKIPIVNDLNKKYSEYNNKKFFKEWFTDV